MKVNLQHKSILNSATLIKIRKIPRGCPPSFWDLSKKIVVFSPYRSCKVLVAFVDELPPSDTLLDKSVSPGDNESLRNNNEIALFASQRTLLFIRNSNAQGIGIMCSIPDQELLAPLYPIQQPRVGSTLQGQLRQCLHIVAVPHVRKVRIVSGCR